jgi:uncharacterized membrane protein
MSTTTHRLHAEEINLLGQLREARRKRVRQHAVALTFGERVSDRVAAVMGSWTFIIIQSVVLVAWMAVNVVAWVQAWDPYPFILLNLVLSFQAAFAAPIIMMSQNRQASIDRNQARHDYEVNVKAELEIELLHQKIDLLRETEIQELTRAIENLSQRLAAGERPAAAP